MTLASFSNGTCPDGCSEFNDSFTLPELTFGGSPLGCHESVPGSGVYRFGWEDSFSPFCRTGLSGLLVARVDWKPTTTERRIHCDVAFDSGTVKDVFFDTGWVSNAKPHDCQNFSNEDVPFDSWGSGTEACDNDTPTCKLTA
jgi:hypothetical protein